MEMRLKYALIFGIFALTMLLICRNSLTEKAFASSPSFARQEIIDGSLDLEAFGLIDKSSSLSNLSSLVSANCTRVGHNITLPEIETVSYLSNGKYLNATIWLSGLIEKEPPISRIPIYRMGIGNIPTHGTTLKVDYFVSVHWDPFKQTWVKTIEESPSSMDRRVIEEERNYTHLFDDEKNVPFMSSNQSKSRISLTLDLDTVGSPKQYFLTFGLYDSILKKGIGLCGVGDFVDTIAYIPPAEFKISISQNPLILRPGDEKTIQLEINPSTIVRPNVTLYSDQNEALEVEFIPNKTYVPAGGVATSLVNVKASDKAAECLRNVKASDKEAECPYTLPIYANISFPKIDFLDVGLDNSATITDKISTSIIPTPSYFTVIVKPPLNWEEKFKGFWETYGEVISLIGGGFAAGFTALVFDRVRRRKESPS
jgi:hypothetical protein